MEQIVNKLDEINNTLKDISGTIKKPENPFYRALTLAGVGVGILGIIHVIDTIINWFGGLYDFTAYSGHSINYFRCFHRDDSQAIKT